MKVPRINLSGQRFGRWEVIEFGGISPSGEFMWRCKCDCGKAKLVSRGKLKSGLSKSCGCLPSDINTKHGHCKGSHESRKYSREYSSWKYAKARCYNPKNGAYKYYGARGLAMEDDWKNDFSAFLKDMGPCPPGFTIERKDNNKGYIRGNVKWASIKEQSWNRRNNVKVPFLGGEMSIAELSYWYKIPPQLLWHRLYNGWSPREAVMILPGAKRGTRQRFSASTQLNLLGAAFA